MSSERFDTYGFPDLDIEAARLFVEARLGVQLRWRDSSYQGESYALRVADDSNIELYANEFEGKVRVSQYVDYGVLLELSRLLDMDALRDRLLVAPSSVSVVLLTSRTVKVADDTDDDGGHVCSAPKLLRGRAAVIDTAGAGARD